jgi:glycosyltransferase involved in cell wall biosynthesis
VSLHVAVDANVLEAPWGGIPKHTHRIVEQLVERGDRVDLLVNLREWESPIPGARAVPLRLRGRPLWRDLAVPLWAARNKPDVLWAPETILPRRIATPTVATVHDLAPLLFPGSKPPQVERAFRTSVPRSVRRATRVICVSETTAHDVASHWGVHDTTVIGNGVDDVFAPGEPDPHGVEGPFVLHVGSLEPRKGLDVLIAAAAEKPGWRLVLVGQPGYEGETIAAAARAAGAVLMSHPGDEPLAGLYRAAEVVAAPSLYEGFGIVPLEAMASGTPAVVARDAGALAEVAGDAAIQVAERTPEAWIRAIAEARERRAELVPQGLERAKRHRWPAVADAVRAVLTASAAS